MYWSLKSAGTRAIWQKTVFGWILSERVQSEQINPLTCCSENSIHNEVQKFWEIEEVVELT